MSNARFRVLSIVAAFLLSTGAGIALFETEEEGERLARTYCQTCHLLPTPEMLDRPTWISKVFPVMRRYMGMDQLAQREALPHDLASFFPTFPAMTEDEWFAIAQWYLDKAPENFPDPPAVSVAGESDRFESSLIVADVALPLTTCVVADTANRQLVVGDGIGNRLLVTDLQGKINHIVPLNGPPSSVAARGSSWYVTDMGKLLPHDSAVGKLHRVDWQGGKPTVTLLLDTLRRPTHVVVEDINGDGRADYLVCEYGNLIGRFGWYEVDAKGRSKYHRLADLPGAIRAEIRDIDADGRKDIVVLMAQAREGLMVYYNRGKGKYQGSELLTLPPCYGTSSFTFVDVDGDGKDEIVVTTGDNGDYDDPPLKPYHGVYVFEQNGKGYRQRSFQHLDGAYGAIVRDFDANGVADMISYAYFPRFDRGSIDWIRHDEGVFTPSQKSYTVGKAERGRWLVSTVADIDGDGDLDVLLGNASMGPGVAPEKLSTSWMSGGVMALILRNTTR